MARFVMANRISGRGSPFETARSHEAFETLWEREIRPVSSKLGTLEASDVNRRRVIFFEADPRDLSIRTAGHSNDVIVEPEILHRVKKPMYTAQTAGAVELSQLDVSVLDERSRPLNEAKVVLFVRTQQGEIEQLASTTARSGRCRFQNPSGQWTALSVVVLPAGGYWSMGVAVQSNTIEVRCPRLEFEKINWWNLAVGAGGGRLSAGYGIRLGVLDSGVGPHPCLSHVSDLGSLINGTRRLDGGRDVSGHGTQVCGVIGSRPFAVRQVIGVAPDVEILSMRVEDSSGTANQGDIAAGIDLLAQHYNADLINLSLVSEQASEIEYDAIASAHEIGTLCLCAAGNSGGAVAYPAAFPIAVAISAVGKQNWAPNGTLASTMTPTGQDKIGTDGFFLANFSCFGPELSCTSPGVGIVSTVPETRDLYAPFADCSGTSLATPLAAATLAALLSGNEAFLSSQRDSVRALRARAILEENCKSIGLDVTYQGRGLPQEYR